MTWQLSKLRHAYPFARLLGGNTATGLFKDGLDEEEGPGNMPGQRVVISLEGVKETRGFVATDKAISE